LIVAALAVLAPNAALAQTPSDRSVLAEDAAFPRPPMPFDWRAQIRASLAEIVQHADDAARGVAPAPPQVRYVRVTRAAAVVQSPRGDAPVVAAVAPGEIVEVLDERDGWYLVRPAGGGVVPGWQTGWLPSSLVAAVPESGGPGGSSRPGAPVPPSSADPQWSAVRALTPGVRVQVRGLTRRDQAQGSLLSASDDGLTVQTGSGPRTLQRDQVRTVSLVNPKRTQWTIVGAAVGAGLMIPLQLSASRRCFSSGACVPQDVSMGRLLLNTSIAVGAASPFVWLARNTVVYKR
jgi:hypothetical protein